MSVKSIGGPVNQLPLITKGPESLQLPEKFKDLKGSGILNRITTKSDSFAPDKTNQFNQLLQGLSALQQQLKVLIDSIGPIASKGIGEVGGAMTKAAQHTEKVGHVHTTQCTGKPGAEKVIEKAIQTGNKPSFESFAKSALDAMKHGDKKQQEQLLLNLPRIAQVFQKADPENLGKALQPFMEAIPGLKPVVANTIQKTAGNVFKFAEALGDKNTSVGDKISQGINLAGTLAGDIAGDNKQASDIINTVSGAAQNVANLAQTLGDKNVSDADKAKAGVNVVGDIAKQISSAAGGNNTVAGSVVNTIADGASNIADFATKVGDKNISDEEKAKAGIKAGGSIIEGIATAASGGNPIASGVAKTVTNAAAGAVDLATKLNDKKATDADKAKAGIDFAGNIAGSIAGAITGDDKKSSDAAKTATNIIGGLFDLGKNLFGKKD